MKKAVVLISLCCTLFVFSFNSLSQGYQIPNGDFENWTSSNAEPNQTWNSFSSGDCALTGIEGTFGCGTAKTNHHTREIGRNGTGYSMRIYSTNPIGSTIANGNITTGQIRMGSSNPPDVGNYNITLRANSKHNLQLSGTPDSLYFWTKFTPSANPTTNTTDSARVSFIFHGNSDFADPRDANISSLYKGKAIHHFSNTFGTWQLQKVPFVYNGTNTDAITYTLITFTTNKTPGGGSNNDQAWFDDIILIYSAWLTDIKLNGTTIPGFQQGIFSYNEVFPRGTNPFSSLPTITYTSQVNDVTINDNVIMGSNNSIDGAKRVIQVIAEDGVTVKTYTINFSIWKSPDTKLNEFAYTVNNGTPNNIIVPVQTPDSAVQHIYISLPPGTSQAPEIVSTSLVLSDTGARATVTQASTPRSTATIVVRAENGTVKTYNIHFSVQLSGNADLANLYYGSTPVSNFHPDTLLYNVVLAPGTVNPPQITAAMAWPGLSPSIIQATILPGTASIVATAENGNKKIYTVNFTVGIDTNASLSEIKYSNKPITNFHPDTLAYVVELPYGTTQATLAASCSSSLATMVIQQASQIPGSATITVTAQNTAYTKTYTINFILGRNNNASLSTLKYTLEGETFSVSGFNAFVEHYSVVLPTGTTSTPVLTYELQDPNASAISSGPASARDTGRIIVTAENGSTVKTYVVAFSIALSTDASLRGIKIDTATLVSFSPNTLSYNITLDTFIVPTITVATTDEKATYRIVYPDTIPGQAQIIVSAEDTTVKRIYKLNLSLAASDNPNLIDLSYELNDISYSVPDFHPDTLIYRVVLPSQTINTPKIVCQTADFSAEADITQPVSPYGAGIIMVTSSDEENTKIYQVYFSVEISTNAKLDSLFYDGIPIPDFNPSILSYSVELPYTTTSPAVVLSKAQSKAAIVHYLQPGKIADSAVILVTAEDLKTICKYVIYFTRQLSPVATLSTLAYTLAGADSTIADFQEDITSYIVNIAPETVAIPQLVYTSTDTKATVQLLRSPLQTNDTAIVRVTAEDQVNSMEYVVIFNRIRSSNNCLHTLHYNGILLENFHHDTLNYTVILPWEENQKPVITAYAQWDSSQVHITQPGTTFGNARIQVIPEDGQQARYYDISFERGSNVALQELTYTLNGITYPVSDFMAEDTAYHVLLPIGTTDIPTLNHVLLDTRSSVIVTDVDQPNGIGKVEINGWDDLNRKTYTVEFEVELSKEALLLDLLADGITIDGFHADTLVYFVEYEYGTTALPMVTAIAKQPDARIEYVQIDGYPGTAIIKVYAGDTSIQKTYTISFNIEAGDNTFLSDLLIDNTSLSGFDKNVFFYEVSLPYGTVTLPAITATPEDERSVVAVTQALQIGDTVKVEVRSLNGEAAEYRIYFIIEKNSNAYASKIVIDGVNLESFKRNTRNYNYALDANHTGIPVVEVELEDVNATYVIIDTDTIPGQTVIEVTAENGIDQYTYRINFLKGGTNVVSFENDVEISLYPNPSSDNINFMIKGISQTSNLELYTIEGRLIGSYILHEGINTINIENLQRSVYFYKVFLDKKTLGTGKFIKQ